MGRSIKGAAHRPGCDLSKDEPVRLIQLLLTASLSFSLLHPIRHRQPPKIHLQKFSSCAGTPGRRRLTRYQFDSSDPGLTFGPLVI